VEAVLGGGGDAGLVDPMEGDNRVVGSRRGRSGGSDGVVTQEAGSEPRGGAAQSGDAKQTAPAQAGSRRRLFTAA
jgi:hypothetical protein